MSCGKTPAPTGSTNAWGSGITRSPRCASYRAFDSPASPMSRTMLTLAAIVVLVYLGLCALLFMAQRSLIYFPHPPSPPGRPATISLPVDGGEVLVTVRAHS